MSKIHLFNPENDLALALGCRHYTPPPHAAQLHRAGALLPAWWAEPGDSVIAPYPEVQEDAQWLRSHWGLNVNISPSDPLSTPMPWGWSLDTHRQFVKARADISALPSEEKINQIRDLSHRRSSIKILSALHAQNLLPKEIFDTDTAMKIVKADCVHFFKSPWSCSGRGVFSTESLTDKVLHDKVAGIIHRQGSIMAERKFNKTDEFGALFRSDGKGGVSFEGLSMFLTESRGAYLGNIIASQEWFKQRIDSYGLTDNLEYYTSRLESILSNLIGTTYNGWFGIDMMIYHDDEGKLHLHPCIELNLRMTMGVVAMEIERRINPARPMIMGWQLNDTTHDLPETLLPPRQGFALIIKNYQTT